MRKSPVRRQGLFFTIGVDYTPDRLELISLKTLPMMGPRTIKAAITTMATKTRMRAYSTRPWPFSLGANNMWGNLLSLVFPGKTSAGCSYFTSERKKGKRVKGGSPNNYVSLTRLKAMPPPEEIFQMRLAQDNPRTNLSRIRGGVHLREKLQGEGPGPPSVPIVVNPPGCQRVFIECWELIFNQKK